jgi:hypothetical protein
MFSVEKTNGGQWCITLDLIKLINTETQVILQPIYLSSTRVTLLTRSRGIRQTSKWMIQRDGYKSHTDDNRGSDRYNLNLSKEEQNQLFSTLSQKYY